MIVARNIALWFLSVLIAVSLFSLLVSLQPPYGWREDVFASDFRITMKLALPVAFLFLPIVIKQRDAEEGRAFVIVGSGFVIGPAYLLLLGVIAAIRGDPHAFERDEASPFGIDAFLIFAAFVGSLTTVLYITALKLAHLLTRHHVLAGHPRR